MNDKDKEAFEKLFLGLDTSHTTSAMKLNRGWFEAWQAACEYKQKDIDFLEAMNGRLEEARVAHLGTSEKYQAENKKLRETLEFIASHDPEHFVCESYYELKDEAREALKEVGKE